MKSETDDVIVRVQWYSPSLTYPFREALEGEVSVCPKTRVVRTAGSNVWLPIHRGDGEFWDVEESHRVDAFGCQQFWHRRTWRGPLPSEGHRVRLYE